MRHDSARWPAESLDNEALSVLRRRLVAMVARVCPGGLSAHADDIVQAAMLRIIDSLRSGERIASLRSLYVKKAAYTAMVDEIRRLRLNTYAADGEKVISRAAATNALNPEENAQIAQLGHGIRQCLSGLVSARRVAVTLYLHGHTVPEASRLGRWSLKQAENLVYRGLADLRRCLTMKGLAPGEQ